MTLITGQRILCALGNLGPGLSQLPLAKMRYIYDRYDQWFGSGIRSDISTEDRLIKVAKHSLPIRLYRPINTVPTLTMVYFHGGGYVIGSLESHHSFCSLMAGEAGINVIAVDYRRAPESPFPGPIADGLTAWNWVVEHRAELGIQDTRIGLGGDSAGGNLSAVVAMQTFKEVVSGQLAVSPDFQFLLYPWVDTTFGYESIKRFGKGLLLTEKTMQLFRNHYLPEGITDLVLSADPMACKDTSAIPDTLIVTAEYDVLRDEGLAFVDKLKQAQVNVIHQHLPDCT
ncbi:MAG: hypothetical protein CMK25_07995, partial [Porticoccaceae bacterium]|nr:hypothetical protein [Porticoccaceae bacterium]